MSIDRQRLFITQRWVQKAREDLLTVQVGVEQKLLPPSICCVHAQQATEKIVKAALLWLEIPFPRNHFLQEHLRLLPLDWRIEIPTPVVKGLTKWIWEGRYPGNWEDPTEEDAASAFYWAHFIWDHIITLLGNSGYTDEPIPYDEVIDPSE